MAKLDRITINGTQHEIVPEIASLFDESVNYSAGDYVIKDATLYRFKFDHTGVWTGSDVNEIVISDKLENLRDAENLKEVTILDTAGQYFDETAFFITKPVFYAQTKKTLMYRLAINTLLTYIGDNIGVKVDKFTLGTGLDTRGNSLIFEKACLFVIFAMSGDSNANGMALGSVDNNGTVTIYKNDMLNLALVNESSFTLRITNNTSSSDVQIAYLVF